MYESQIAKLKLVTVSEKQLGSPELTKKMNAIYPQPNLHPNTLPIIN